MIVLSHACFDALILVEACISGYELGEEILNLDTMETEKWRFREGPAKPDLAELKANHLDRFCIYGILDEEGNEEVDGNEDDDKGASTH